MALQGTLDTFSLPDVLRLLAGTNKTGRLLVEGSRGTGGLWMAEGDVIGGAVASAPRASTPVDVVFELLRFDDGTFVFDPDGIPEGADDAASVDAVLAEAEAQLEEWRGIEAVISTVDSWVTLVPDPGDDELVLSREQWMMLVAIGDGRTVRRLGDRLDDSELAVGRLVKELIEAGLVEVGDHPPGYEAGGSHDVTLDVGSGEDHAYLSNGMATAEEIAHPEAAPSALPEPLPEPLPSEPSDWTEPPEELEPPVSVDDEGEETEPQPEHQSQPQPAAQAEPEAEPDDHERDDADQGSSPGERTPAPAQGKGLSRKAARALAAAAGDRDAIGPGRGRRGRYPSPNWG